MRLHSIIIKKHEKTPYEILDSIARRFAGNGNKPFWDVVEKDKTWHFNLNPSTDWSYFKAWKIRPFITLVYGFRK